MRVIDLFSKLCKECVDNLSSIRRRPESIGIREEKAFETRCLREEWIFFSQIGRYVFSDRSKLSGSDHSRLRETRIDIEYIPPREESDRNILRLWLANRLSEKSTKRYILCHVVRPGLEDIVTIIHPESDLVEDRIQIDRELSPE